MMTTHFEGNGSVAYYPEPQFWIALLYVGIMEDLGRKGIPTWGNLQSWGPSNPLLNISLQTEIQVYLINNQGARQDEDLSKSETQALPLREPKLCP